MLARLFIFLFVSSMFTVPAQAGEKGILGALIGAGVGAGVGHAVDRTGGSGKGAVIGAIGGYVVGDQMEKAEKRNTQTHTSRSQDSYQSESTGRSINYSGNCNEADTLLNRAERSQDLEYKVYLLQKAGRLCPGNARLHNDLGVAYYQRDSQYDRQRARDEFNEAVRIDPGYDVARNNLARL